MFAKIIYFDSEDKLKNTIDGLTELIEVCGHASVADFYELVGHAVKPIDHDYGWTDITDYQTSYDDKLQYICLQLPEAEVLTVQPKELPENTQDDPMVNHPGHYQSGTGLEAWDVIKAFTSDLNGVEAFDTGNVIKYMCRWKKKNGLQDLEKALCYLNHLIDTVKNSEKEND